MSEAVRLRLRLEPEGSGTFVIIPADAVERLGARGRTSVRGTVNGTPFRNQVMPYRDAGGDGRTWYMVVNRAVRDAAGGLAAGDEVDLVLERDDEPRVVDVSPELAAAVADGDAAEAWRALPQSQRNDYAAWVAGAKREETRRRRAAEVASRLRGERRA